LVENEKDIGKFADFTVAAPEPKKEVAAEVEAVKEVSTPSAAPVAEPSQPVTATPETGNVMLLT
jgi:hypothetical protein